MSIYSALIAEPGTGKSQAMKLVRKSVLDIEDFLKIEPENSKLVNGKLYNFVGLYLE